MFATASHMDVTSDSPRKRGRDEELAEEHRHKRVQCLPLRSSPRQHTNADMMTDSIPNQFSSFSSPHADVARLDMMETLNSAPPSRLESVRVDDHPDAGRIPTPMQPNFAQQVRGTQNMGHQYSGFDAAADSSCIPRSMTNEEELHAMQQNRRLPSPISEGADPHQDHEMEHPMMDMEPRASTPPVGSDGEPLTPSPKRGHVRNMHTINNWTWQPGMKKSLSIGFRSDCEKCRLKVPGHFNHIIVS